MKKNKVIFLDRDGTINYDYGYVYQREKLQFLPFVIEALKVFKKLGYKLIIVTNQSGIGRGYFTIEQYNIFNEYMLNKLKESDVFIDKVYYCPHIVEDNCNCRKPRTGLFDLAISEFNIDLNNSYVIGDNERDLSLCNVSNITGILLGKENDNYICKKDMKEVINYITNK